MAKSKNEPVGKKYILPDGLIRINIRMQNLGQEDLDVLKKYGNVKRGLTISRDIIVPDDMPLRSLHYVIQRAFGFQDSHEHLFRIFMDPLKKLTENKMENLLNLRGIILHQEKEMDDFFVMDIPMFTGGDFNKWMQKQYTGPYMYDEDFLGDYHLDEDNDEDDFEDEHLASADDIYYIVEKVKPSGKDESTDRAIFAAEDFESVAKSGKPVKLEEKNNGWEIQPVCCAANDPDVCTVRKVRLGDLSIEDGFDALHMSVNQVIERLKIKDVLGLSEDYLPFDEKWKEANPLMGLKFPQIVTSEQIQKALEEEKEIDPAPFADILGYTYDFGDSWQFYITGSKGYTDLIEQKVVTAAQAEKSITKVQKKHRPVLLAADGDMLIEDSGNLGGYIDFVGHLRLGPDDAIVEKAGDYGEGQYQGDWEELQDEEDVDDNGMTRAEVLEWAISQGWHRNDYKNYSLL